MGQQESTHFFVAYIDNRKTFYTEVKELTPNRSEHDIICDLRMQKNEIIRTDKHIHSYSNDLNKNQCFKCAELGKQSTDMFKAIIQQQQDQ